MFRKMLGLAFLTAGFAATVASSVFGSRGSVAVDTGLRSPMALQALLRQRPRSQGGTESEGRDQCQSCPLHQWQIWESSWFGSRIASFSRDRRSWQPCKPRWCRLGKLTSSPNAMLAHPKPQFTMCPRPSNVKRLLRRRSRPSWLNWRRQPRKPPSQCRKPSRKRSNARRTLIGYMQKTTRNWHAWFKPRILSHTFKSPCAMRSRPFLIVLKPSLSSHSWSRLYRPFVLAGGCNAHAGDHRRAHRRCRHAAGHGAHGRGGGQSLRTLAGRPPRGRERCQKAENQGYH